MANSDIKTRLVLQGEKEYSKGMKDAAANVKELDSRLKVVKSEFEKTGDAQKYAAEQAQILKEKHGAKFVHINHVGAVIGSHAGPGVLALFFLGDHR